MKKSNLYLLTALCFVTVLYSQDPHFSQFNEQASLINPALTGIDDPIRIGAGYKQQWKSVSSPFTTYGASVESRLKPGNWEQVDNHRGMTFKERSVGRLAAGLSVYRDNAGNGNFDMTQVNLSLSTFIPTGKQSFLSCGLQGSFAQKKLNSSTFLFPNQYSGSGYDPGIASNENFAGQNFNNFDVGAGLVWSYKNKPPLGSHENIKANIGFSVYHINTPKQSYLIASKNDLYSKYVLYGDFLISATGARVALVPRFLAQVQGKSSEVLVGLQVKNYLSGGSKYTGIAKSNCISYGLYYRANDAFIPNLLLEWKEQYAVGLSYDINISRLTGTSSGRGGPEIMLKYTPPRAFLYQKKKNGASNSGN